MNVFQFIFSFLFVRNWHTGERELSYPRMALFLGMLVLIVVAFGMIALLQEPIVYETI